MQHEVAGFDAVLDILEKEEWRRTTLHANHAYLKSGLDKLGYNVEASKSQIIALEAGDIRQTTTLRDALESRGVFGAIFFPPATPEKRCIIRFTLNCGLTRRELDYIIEVCDDIRLEVGMAEWRSTKRKALDQAKAAALRLRAGARRSQSNLPYPGAAASTAAGCTTGRSIVKVVPTLAVDRHAIVPPQPSIIIRQNDSPRPVPTPGRCADTNGMNT